MFGETEPERRQESGGERRDDQSEEPFQGGAQPERGEQAAGGTSGDEGERTVGEGGEGELHEMPERLAEQGEPGQTQVPAPDDDAAPSQSDEGN